MHTRLLLAFLLLPSALLAAPGLTIYNQNFAVVRDQVPLDLKAGVNEVKFDGATMHLEPDSVILRDPSGSPLQILEQNYRNDPVTQQLLLSLFEGREINFLVGQDRLVKGRVVRSGYGAGAGQPIIEVNGQLQFSLPGQPLFPSLGDNTILKPQLSWLINAPKAFQTTAELGYITGGMSWNASYNVVAPEKGDLIDIIGWVTMDNQSGRDFVDARIKLMAGDVSKLAPQETQTAGARRVEWNLAKQDADIGVTEKTFDEYHLYTLERSTTLRDRETKQIEFIRASGVKSETVYVYDGLYIDWNRWSGYDMASRRGDENFGSQNTSKVAVMREFKNTKANGLGLPLPRGRVRFYRANGAQLEFTGENKIDHTPADELVRIYTGDAFDLVGERKRTNITVNNSAHWVDESFEITLRNHKKDPVTIRVIEHLYRWNNWEITEKDAAFTKLNSETMEFRVDLKPDEERKITYTVHYSW